MYRITSNPFYTEVTCSIKSAKNRLDKALNAYLELICGDELKDCKISIECIPYLAKIHDDISELKKFLLEAKHE